MKVRKSTLRGEVNVISISVGRGMNIKEFHAYAVRKSAPSNVLMGEGLPPCLVVKADLGAELIRGPRPYLGYSIGR